LLAFSDALDVVRTWNPLASQSDVTKVSRKQLSAPKYRGKQRYTMSEEGDSDTREIEQLTMFF
jgi:hypothetical protein